MGNLACVQQRLCVYQGNIDWSMGCNQILKRTLQSGKDNCSDNEQVKGFREEQNMIRFGL